MTTCTTCENGKFGPSLGAIPCELCGEGKYSVKGKPYCTYCPIGTIAKLQGSSYCKNCSEYAKGTATNEGQTECQCPINQFLMPYPEARCMDCYEGTNCNEMGLKLTTIPTTAGWWRDSENSTKFYKCLEQRHCKGGIGGANYLCFGNREGPLCALCSPRHFSAMESCFSCPTTQTFQWLYIVLVAGGLTLLSILQLWILLKLKDSLLTKGLEEAKKKASYKHILDNKQNILRSGFL
eukprot:TRINITY_DN1610_c0_g1_i1.p1 TRINITY_DN1610_c0_g1~~TRINITY_DN1610_c0_g1_i1.p1  ORF type:complete len:237 (+),score=19.42 TRINITY_DN1610_c0_g1_i1:485-1195(+)